MDQSSAMKKYTQIISDLLWNLDKMEDSSSKILEQVEFAIMRCKNALEQLRELVCQDGFPDQECEIYFFKKLKTEVYSKFLYYLEVFNIQSKLPTVDRQCQINHYKKKKKKYCEFMKEHQTEVQYLQCGYSHFDKNYFTRDRSEISLPERNEYYLTDEIFHTLHDHTFSAIIANQMLIEYIQKEIRRLNGFKRNTQVQIKSKLKWTGYKIFLIELAYGVHYTQMVNGGNSEIKDIIEGLEQMFNIELKEYYRSFVEIKRRIDRTKFLDLMKSKLENKMDESDL